MDSVRQVDDQMPDRLEEGDVCRVGLLSDTHSFLDSKILDFFKDCDEVWHCGDIGDETIVDRLREKHRLRAVYGNIDGGNLRLDFPATAVFECGGMKVLMTHIGGYPGHYDSRIYRRLLQERPGLFVCGHSHILKVMSDPRLGCMHINPGAAGRYGFHQVRTVVRFVLEKGKIRDLEVLELKK